MTYYDKALIVLSTVIKCNSETLTKEQCKVISECFKILSEDEVTKEIFCHIDNMLMDIDLNWLESISDVLGG